MPVTLSPEDGGAADQAHADPATPALGPASELPSESQSETGAPKLDATSVGSENPKTQSETGAPKLDATSVGSENPKTQSETDAPKLDATSVGSENPKTQSETDAPKLDATSVGSENPKTEGKAGNENGKGVNQSDQKQPLPVINRHVLGAFHNPDVYRMDVATRSKVFEDCYKHAESTVRRPSSTSSAAEKLAKQTNIQTAFMLGANVPENQPETKGADSDLSSGSKEAAPESEATHAEAETSLEDALEKLMDTEYPSSPAAPGSTSKPKAKAKARQTKQTPPKVAAKPKASVFFLRGGDFTRSKISLEFDLLASGHDMISKQEVTMTMLINFILSHFAIT